MFLLNDEKSEIALKSSEGFVMLEHEGAFSFPSKTEEGPQDVLLLNFGSAREFLEAGKVKTFTGAYTFHEYNAYHQCLYEGTIGAEDHALILSTGTLIDMSDSCLVLVNLSKEEALRKLLAIAKDHEKQVTKKEDQKSLTDFMRYAKEKLGLPVEPEKKSGGLFGFLHRK